MSEFQRSQKKIDDDKKIPWMLCICAVVIPTIVFIQICLQLNKY